MVFTKLDVNPVFLNLRVATKIREAILSASRHNFKYVGLLITDSYFSTSVLKAVFFLIKYIHF
jgi:hypothetical protein